MEADQHPAANYLRQIGFPKLGVSGPSRDPILPAFRHWSKRRSLRAVLDLASGLEAACATVTPRFVTSPTASSLHFNAFGL